MKHDTERTVEVVMVVMQQHLQRALDRAGRHARSLLRDGPDPHRPHLSCQTCYCRHGCDHYGNCPHTGGDCAEPDRTTCVGHPACPETDDEESYLDAIDRALAVDRLGRFMSQAAGHGEEVHHG